MNAFWTPFVQQFYHAVMHLSTFLTHVLSSVEVLKRCSLYTMNRVLSITMMSFLVILFSPERYGDCSGWLSHVTMKQSRSLSLSLRVVIIAICLVRVKHMSSIVKWLSTTNLRNRAAMVRISVAGSWGSLTGSSSGQNGPWWPCFWLNQ